MTLNSKAISKFLGCLNLSPQDTCSQCGSYSHSHLTIRKWLDLIWGRFRLDLKKVFPPEGAWANEQQIYFFISLLIVSISVISCEALSRQVIMRLKSHSKVMKSIKSPFFPFAPFLVQCSSRGEIMHMH